MAEPPAIWKGSHNLISTQQADALMREHAFTWKCERRPLSQAHNHFLAEDLSADRDGPPFNRVAMDGIAMDSAEYLQGQRDFHCQGMQAAGSPQLTREGDNSCLEAMTGSVLPNNCDAVIPFEKCKKLEDKLYQLPDDLELKEMLNIHTLGCDFKRGDLLLESSKKLRAAEIAVAASLGVTDPLVYLPPSIAIITTGSELVDVAETPLPHQIRKSNIHAAAACLNHFNFDNVHLYHIPDNYEDTLNKLGSCLEQHDVLILSGGVSKGKLDFVPGALEQLGVHKHFHRIAQKPGKPMWFGTKDHKCIYALPGNPVSLLVCLRRYVIPALLHSISPQSNQTQYIALSEDFKPKPSLTLFSAVSTTSSPTTGLIAKRVSHHGSGDYASLIHSQGFVQLEPSADMVPAGSIVPYYPWEQL